MGWTLRLPFADKTVVAPDAVRRGSPEDRGDTATSTLGVGTRLLHRKESFQRELLHRLTFLVRVSVDLWLGRDARCTGQFARPMAPTVRKRLF